MQESQADAVIALLERTALALESIAESLVVQEGEGEVSHADLLQRLASDVFSLHETVKGIERSLP